MQINLENPIIVPIIVAVVILIAFLPVINFIRGLFK